MNKATWVLQVVVALLFLATGGMKLVTPKDALRQEPRMRWTQEFSDGAITAIGAAEVAGAIGLVVPAATKIAPMLTPVAGVGLAALMGGAAVTHLRLGESALVPLILAVLSLAAAVLRFRQLPRR